MTALVTGATGFVGSAVARKLIGAGKAVRVLVRADSDRRNIDGLGVEALEGELGDRASLARALEGCDALYHVAADYRLWTPDPAALYGANVDGSRGLIEAALAAAGPTELPTIDGFELIEEIGEASESELQGLGRDLETLFRINTASQNLLTGVRDSRGVLIAATGLDDQERLLLGPDPPPEISDDEFSRMLGVEKQRGHLNYLYGVTAERGLILAVEEAIRKRRVARGYSPSDDRIEDAYVNLYRAT
ncbi:MAG: NAD-dependent epimerase/dehydratase family protein, partial [Proteobacteria bacterium]|nr:NAD-dependent epimerase/dehydratase family protein [Pseudomonadota bacterium]